MIHIADRLPSTAIDSTQLARWRAIPTPVASDALQGRGLLNPSIRSIASVRPTQRMAGIAVTAACEPPDFGAVLHAVSVAGPGEIVVIAAGGSCECAVLGELLGGSARLKGVAGVICDGAVRDIGTLGQWTDFPVFALGSTARGPASKERGSVNGEVSCGGVPISPGDLIVADDDGVIAIPAAEAAAALALAEARLLAEQDWEKQLQAGRSVVEVFGVPAAQRRQPN